MGLQVAFLTVAQLSFAAEGSAKTYADAYKTTQDTGKPLVVLVGADWCPYCQVMKTSVMPQVASHGDLQNVSFAYVNSDQQSDLAGKLLTGKSIPQLVMYEKTAEGWKQTRLVGGQSAEAVEGFLGAAKPMVAAQKPAGDSQPTTAATAVVTTGKTAGS
jgi:thiol-disulfide isomerase/thioredoxin